MATCGVIKLGGLCIARSHADLVRTRARGCPDLLIAAVAERAGLTVLHYDADYELVAAVTGQPVRWVVPRGAVP